MVTGLGFAQRLLNVLDEGNGHIFWVKKLRPLLSESQNRPCCPNNQS